MILSVIKICQPIVIFSCQEPFSSINRATLRDSIASRERHDRTHIHTHMEVVMALPIGVTPILEGKEAKTFRRIIEEGLKKPAKFVATPNLEKARVLAREHAERKRK